VVAGREWEKRFGSHGCILGALRQCGVHSRALVHKICTMRPCQSVRHKGAYAFFSRVGAVRSVCLFVCLFVSGWEALLEVAVR